MHLQYESKCEKNVPFTLDLDCVLIQEECLLFYDMRT